MTAASTLDELRPGLGQLARALATGEDHDIVLAAKALDLRILDAALDPPKPILIPRGRSPRRTVSVRERTARRLEKAAADPYSALDSWERGFAVNVILTLRSTESLTDKQAPIVERLLRKIRRRS